ncbi:MAG TPA: 23S rRNA (guanosine(2251)-2'-O)-methyltransferase RlmB [Eubacteriaceae bacterium]|nr:23S rRNA (guanosine(2251)-2'-O)-methyltransferase RlmB [Eubacteriaceae bacterium]
MSKNKRTEGEQFRDGKDSVRQIEGKNPVLEALKSDATIEKIMIAKGRKETQIAEILKIAKERKLKIQMVDRKKLDYSSQTGNHQGVVAIATDFQYGELEDLFRKAKKKNTDPFIVILDQITDPHNFGAIIRTANAFGADGIVIPKNRSADITPIVVKASAGAIEHTIIVKETNLTQTIQKLKEQGVWVCATEMGGTPYYKNNLKGPLAIVIGSEGEGISRLVKEHCDFSASIPMAGEIESLNASVAAGVIFAEAARQRGEA